jgi:cytochrome d ubiquinol oxidase subunit II
MSIQPAWDGNEGWLLAAGAATFFAFNDWFEGLLTGFTAWFATIFVALILRALALQRRTRSLTARGRAQCDAVLVVCSIVPAALLGLLFANFLRGVDLDGGGSVRTETIGMLSPYALLGSAVAVAFMGFHGATFVAMRTSGRTHVAAQRATAVLAPLVLCGVVAFVAWTESARDVGVLSLVTACAASLTVAVAVWTAVIGRQQRAFRIATLAALLVPTWMFSTLWPDVLFARNNPALSLSVHNTAASSTGMIVLTVVGVELAAVVLVYLAWSYWIFHSRVTGKNLIAGPRQAAASLRPVREPATLAVAAAPVAGVAEV